MCVPKLLDNVRVKGKEGVFLIVRVYEADECVDVVPWGGEYVLIERLPFANIERFAAGYWRWPKG
jgi:hypothetical protein